MNFEENKKYEVTFKTLCECVAEEIRYYTEVHSITINDAIDYMKAELHDDMPFYLPSEWYGNTVVLEFKFVEGEALYFTDTESVDGWYIPTYFISSMIPVDED